MGEGKGRRGTLGDVTKWSQTTSSGVTSGGGAGGGCRRDTHSSAFRHPQCQYLCYQCNRTVSFAFSSRQSSELFCPICSGGFLEVVENDSRLSSGSNSVVDLSSSFSGPVYPLAAAFASNMLPMLFPTFPSSFSYSSSSVAGGSSLQASDQNYISSMRAGGADIPFMIEGGGDPVGDYFFGPGMEQLMQHRAENDPNRYGIPPASVQDEFEIGAEVMKIPCKHVYHSDPVVGDACIILARFVDISCQPIDDPDYERLRNASSSGDRAARGVSSLKGAAP
ncbi:hypothetical protein Dimus_027393 [Dionaea muscipula]